MRRDSVKLSPETGANSTPAGSFQLESYGFYRALVAGASGDAAGVGLGGKLLYAGELDSAGQAVMVAGNVAGFATLAVAADQGSRAQAIRDGVADFVVTSLDEALRILKNEIRKHNSVSVCVGADRLAVDQEMLERGVLPDVVFGRGPADAKRACRFGESVREIGIAEAKQAETLVSWQVSQNPARWMPGLDAIAIDCLAEEPWTQRWIRFSPRYLGRAGFTQRAFSCAPRAAMGIVKEFEDIVGKGGIAGEVTVSVTTRGESRVFRLKPASL